MQEKEIVHGRRFVDLTGKRFGFSTIIAFHSKSPRGQSKWLCRCDCGKEFVVWANNLGRRNRLNSCGCKLQELYERGGPNKTHGESGTKVFYAWTDAKQRVSNPNDKWFRYYGGRGIKMCQRYREHYTAFRDDLGPCPPDKKSVGRIDNDGHYSCGNCPECTANGWPMNLRWENQQEQTNNQSRSFHIDGKTVAQIAAENGVPIQVVRAKFGLRLNLQK